MQIESTLISKIAESFDIQKGSAETESSWKGRVIYTLIGMMGYASLWDEPTAKHINRDGEEYVSEENYEYVHSPVWSSIQKDSSENPSNITNTSSPSQTKLNAPGQLPLDAPGISIIHFKNRVTLFAQTYTEIYPNIDLGQDISSLVEMVYETMKAGGLFYHRNYRLIRSFPCFSKGNSLSLARGLTPNEVRHVSGLGLFIPERKEELTTRAIYQMFHLHKYPMIQTWNSVIDQANWRNLEQDIDFEVLNLDRRIGENYWIGRAPKEQDDISLLRFGLPGNRTYFLYQKTEDQLEVSQIPVWRTENGGYSILEAGCRQAHQIEMTIDYLIDGPIVRIHLGYLLPKEEQTLIELYSWPDPDRKLASFYRIMDGRIFNEIRPVLEKEGFVFKEQSS